ncbi:MAG: WD40 repeat domain-containing serine/threonine protein kinase [Verrucomicrobiales bacterium]|nr:WD40 repeat domain-containing serine/threonine protein kinase [Verrucomicrobiales bacterium]
MEATCKNCGANFSTLKCDEVAFCPACMFAALNDDETVVAGSSDDDSIDELTIEDLAPKFPDLEIIKLIGKGGMGRVFLAKQKSLGRHVALKILRSRSKRDVTASERFTREARAMAEVSHPNIVTVYDFDERDGLQFLLMEYIEGSSLSELLKNGALDLEVALPLISQICNAVDCAHRLGILHRDIKPGNILVSKDGDVKVTDFGLAKSLGALWDYSLTTENEGFGTPLYMAPEQRTSAKETDVKSDIFSLAVLFYEMLTGHIPTGGNQKVSGQSSKYKKLHQTILRGLNPDPESRPNSAVEFTEAVESYQSKVARSRKSRKMGIWFGAALLVLLGIVLWLNQREVEGTPIARAPTAGEVKAIKQVTEKYMMRIPEIDLPPGALYHWTPALGSGSRRVARELSNFFELEVSVFFPRTISGYMTDGTVLRVKPPPDAMGTRMLTATWSLTVENTLRALSVTKQPHHFRDDIIPDDVQFIQGGARFTTVLTRDGRLHFAVDPEVRDSLDKLFKEVEAESEIVEIDGYSQVGLFLRADGTISGWDSGEVKMIRDISDKNNWKDIACGPLHFVGVDQDGKVEVWKVKQDNYNPVLAALLEVPDFQSKKPVRVESDVDLIAVQFSDGSWQAWGAEKNADLIRKISEIGPTRDICFRTWPPKFTELYWIGNGSENP